MRSCARRTRHRTAVPFATRCARLGVDGRASGMPAEARAGRRPRGQRPAPRATPTAKSGWSRTHRAAPGARREARTGTRPKPPWPPRNACCSSTTSTVVRSNAARAYGFTHLGRATEDRVGEHERLVAMILEEALLRRGHLDPRSTCTARARAERGSVLGDLRYASNLAIAEYAHGVPARNGGAPLGGAQAGARAERSRAAGHVPRRGDGRLRRQARPARDHEPRGRAGLE